MGSTNGWFVDVLPRRLIKGLATSMSKQLLIKCGAFFLALSMTSVPLLQLLGVRGNQLATALAMYLPSCMAVFFFAFGCNRLRRRHFVLFSMIFFLAVLWLISHLLAQDQHAVLSEYDQKRIYFFIQGFLLASILGVLVGSNWQRTMPSLAFWFLFFTVIIAALYLAHYDPAEAAAHVYYRVEDKLSLSRAILLSIGASVLVAAFYLHYNKISRLGRKKHFLFLSLFFLFLFDIAISGTRGSMLAVFFTVLIALFFTMKQTGRSGLSLSGKLSFISVLFALLVLAILLIYSFAPDASLNRLHDIQETGTDRRLELHLIGLDLLASNPLGVSVGLSDAFGHGSDYCHDTVLQFMLEAGWASIPITLMLMLMFFVGFAKSTVTPQSAALMIVVSNVMLQSLSSGDAYAATVWFSIFLVASMPVNPSWTPAAPKKHVGVLPKREIYA